MKSRGTLVLMEQLIMVLVFALAAALCLQLFAKAGEVSAETARRDEAVLLAQNAAEVLKATGGAESKAEALSTSEYAVEIEKAETDIPGFGQADITVYYGQTPVFTLTVGYQEVGG